MHHNETIECTFCGDEFGEKELLNKHMRSYHPTFSLVKCDVDLQDEQVETKYIEVIPNFRSIELLPFLCKYCTKSYDTKIQLRSHYKSTHKDPTSCIHCFKTFTNNNVFKRHMLIHSNSTISCSECGRCFRRRDALKRHADEKHDGKGLVKPSNEKFVKLEAKKDNSISCDYCHLTFATSRHMHKHKRNDHRGEAVHNCILCEKIYKTAESLQQHRSRSHTGEEFTCQGCGKEFKRNESLKKHKRLICGKPRKLKPFHQLTKWGRSYRAKASTRQLIHKLEGAGDNTYMLEHLGLGNSNS